MTITRLYADLKSVDHTREKRLECVNLLIKKSNLTPKTLDVIFRVNDKIPYRAAWAWSLSAQRI